MKSFIALDFETATPQRNSMCAVGLVVVKNNVITEKYYSLVQPINNEYHPRNIEIHNIMPEHTENAPTFPEVFPTLKSYLDNATVVCHNADFDMSVLFKTMETYGINDAPSMNIHCTMKMCGGAGLAKCCQEMNIPLNHHDPLSDAEASAMIFIKNEVGSLNPVMVGKSKHIDLQFIADDFLRHNPINGTVLKPDLEHAVNSSNYFFGKKVVISGVFETWPDRRDLAEIIKICGGDIDTSVTGLTNILIAGKEAGPSKTSKMLNNILSGRDAEILSEEDIIKILTDIFSEANEKEN